MKKKKQISKKPFIIMAIFVAIAVIGVTADEPRQVLQQAVQICLSCIGIG